MKYFSQLGRRFWLAFAVVALVGGGGCMTMEILNHTTTTKITEKPVLQDTIVAVGEPVVAVQSAAVGEPLLALVGRQNTYVFSEGAKAFHDIQTKLNEQYVQVNFGRDPIVLNLSQANDATKQSVQEISGKVSVTYIKKELELSFAERQSLKSLGFYQMGNGFYTMEINVSGGVYPVAKNVQATQTPLTRERQIKLVAHESHRSVNVSALAWLPLGVAFDVVTSPLQVIFLIGSASSHKAQPKPKKL